MDSNQLFMQNLRVDEVPWHRIPTVYGRATKFPEYFKILFDMRDKREVEMVLKEVIINIEHQETFWHATPFSMIFLVRIFESAVSELEKKEIAYFITEQLLDFFGEMAECFQDVNAREHADQLPLFSDMLKENYLWSEEYNEEEEERRYEEEEIFPDSLFYSFYYYSYQALIACKPILQRLENTKLKAKTKVLQELL